MILCVGLDQRCGCSTSSDSSDREKPYTGISGGSVALLHDYTNCEYSRRELFIGYYYVKLCYLGAD